MISFKKRQEQAKIIDIDWKVINVPSKFIFAGGSFLTATAFGATDVSAFFPKSKQAKKSASEDPEEVFSLKVTLGSLF